MPMLRLIGRKFFAVMVLLGMSAASGQDFPGKLIRLVTAEPGGSLDFQSRLIAPGLSGNLGQQVIVDNRPSGVIIGEIVAKAPPDGYTVLFTGSSFWLAPLLHDQLSWDPVKDFSPIAWVTISPNVLVVHPSLPVKSVKALIALAKSRPGQLDYASAATGTSSHLAAELFKAMAEINIVRIPYKGTGVALNDVIGGQVQMMFPAAGAIAPHVKSGRLRALGVTSLQPSALVPGLPTVASAGLPGYQSASVYGLFAPARTPVPILNRHNQAITRAIAQVDIKDKLLGSGVEPVGSSPEQFAAFVRSEIGKAGKIIKEAGIGAK
jgi:tripartite-type tricarboxylate transporter receptor subunit TctC